MHVQRDVLPLPEPACCPWAAGPAAALSRGFQQRVARRRALAAEKLCVVHFLNSLYVGVPGPAGPPTASQRWALGHIDVAARELGPTTGICVAPQKLDGSFARRATTAA